MLAAGENSEPDGGAGEGQHTRQIRVEWALIGENGTYKFRPPGSNSRGGVGCSRRALRGPERRTTAHPEAYEYGASRDATIRQHTAAFWDDGVVHDEPVGFGRSVTRETRTVSGDAAGIINKSIGIGNS